jgi:hypothetical protein
MPVPRRTILEMKTDRLRPADTKVGATRYMNNLIELQDRVIRFCTKVMLGFKRFTSAATTISDIEYTLPTCNSRFNLATLNLQGCRCADRFRQGFVNPMRCPVRPELDRHLRCFHHNLIEHF